MDRGAVAPVLVLTARPSHVWRDLHRAEARRARPLLAVE